MSFQTHQYRIVLYLNLWLQGQVLLSLRFDLFPGVSIWYITHLRGIHHQHLDPKDFSLFHLSRMNYIILTTTIHRYYHIIHIHHPYLSILINVLTASSSFVLNTQVYLWGLAPTFQIGSISYRLHPLSGSLTHLTRLSSQIHISSLCFKFHLHYSL